MIYIFVLILTPVITFFFINSTLLFLCSIGCVRENYNNRSIPYIAGVIFIPLMFLLNTIILFFRPMNDTQTTDMLLLLCGMSFAGILDDLLGNQEIKGLFNHLKSTLKGMTTTGFIKALIAILIALFVVAKKGEGGMYMILDLSIVLLFTNFLNLLDVRPGRCIKAFLFVSAIFISISWSSLLKVYPLCILLLISLVYAKFDLSERCMLGDVGSNALGVVLGYYSTLVLSLSAKLVLLLFLLVVHLYTEKRSLSVLIHKNRFLKMIDGIGRRNPKI